MSSTDEQNGDSSRTPANVVAVSGADGSGRYHPAVAVGYVLNGTMVSAFGDESTLPPMTVRALWMLRTKCIRFPGTGGETEPLRFLIAIHGKAGEPVTILPE